MIVQHLGLKDESKGLATPAVKGEAGRKGDVGSKSLVPGEAAMYRALVARGIHPAQDRSDIHYIVKELSRRMPAPRETLWERRGTSREIHTSSGTGE